MTTPERDGDGTPGTYRLGSFCDCFEVRVQIGDGLEDLIGRHLDVAGSPVLHAALDAAGAVVTVDMSGLAYDGPNAHVDWGPCLSR